MNPSPAQAGKRVLVAHRDVGALRLLRETLDQFANCTVETSPQAEYAFELALQRTYDLFIFDLDLDVLPGELLYGLLSKAYSHCHEGARIAPPVIYISGDAAGVHRDLLSDARVKGVLSTPLSIQRIIDLTGGALGLKMRAGA